MFQVLARIILGSIFIYASIDKITDPQKFAQIIDNYQMLPQFMVIGVAHLLPFVELILGIFLIVGLFVRISAIVLSSLLMVFMIAIGIKSMNGTIENCGCFSISSPVSNTNVIFLMLRDVIFLLFGLIIIFPKGMKRLNKTFR